MVHSKLNQFAITDTKRKFFQNKYFKQDKYLDETREKSGHHSNSAVNKDWTAVIYCQSLAFDHPYLLCNDHCDQ